MLALDKQYSPYTDWSHFLQIKGIIDHPKFDRIFIIKNMFHFKREGLLEFLTAKSTRVHEKSDSIMNQVPFYIRPEYERKVFVTTFKDPPMPDGIAKFLKEHGNELKEMRRSGNLTGEWKILGSSSFKVALTHPELPGYVMKIGNKLEELSTRNHLIDDYRNSYHAKKIVKDNNYQSLAIPDCYFDYDLDVLVATKFNFSKRPPVDLKEKIDAEFADFQMRSDIRDLTGRNYGFIERDGQKQLAIYDFDGGI